MVGAEIYNNRDWGEVLKFNNRKNLHSNLAKIINTICLNQTPAQFRLNIYILLSKNKKSNLTKILFFDELQKENSYSEQIQKDIPRTTAPQQFNKVLFQVVLDRQLKALSNLCKENGYVQGINVIVGSLFSTLQPNIILLSLQNN